MNRFSSKCIQTQSRKPLKFPSKSRSILLVVLLERAALTAWLLLLLAGTRLEKISRSGVCNGSFLFVTPVLYDPFVAFLGLQPSPTNWFCSYQ